MPTKVISGVARMLKLSSGVRDNPTLPSGLIRREAVGFVLGPRLYLKGRQNLRKQADLQH